MKGQIITSHKVSGLNEEITITVCDDPGDGNACHLYQLLIPNNQAGRSSAQFIAFQKGPIRNAGMNGVSNEALLAIVEHRLQGFQSGDFACRENALALTKIQEAMHWLHHRTRKRVQRGVEGTSKV